MIRGMSLNVNDPKLMVTQTRIRIVTYVDQVLSLLRVRGDACLEDVYNKCLFVLSNRLTPICFFT